MSFKLTSKICNKYFLRHAVVLHLSSYLNFLFRKSESYKSLIYITKYISSSEQIINDWKKDSLKKELFNFSSLSSVENYFSETELI